MTSLRELQPTSDQTSAMTVMLKGLLGEIDFSRLCPGLRVGNLDEDVLQIFVPTENRVADIKLHHADDFAVAAEYALGLPIRMVKIAWQSAGSTSAKCQRQK